MLNKLTKTQKILVKQACQIQIDSLNRILQGSEWLFLECLEENVPVESVAEVEEDIRAKIEIYQELIEDPDLLFSLEPAKLNIIQLILVAFSKSHQDEEHSDLLGKIMTFKNIITQIEGRQNLN